MAFEHEYSKAMAHRKLLSHKKTSLSLLLQGGDRLNDTGLNGLPRQHWAELITIYQQAAFVTVRA